MKDVILEKFLSRLRSLDRTRSRVEHLYKKKSLAKKDVEIAYEALFLKMVTSFEQFLETLFVGIIRGKAGYSRGRVSPKVRCRSLSTAAAIMAEGGQYADWIPYEKHTQERAKKLLRGGRPFTDVNKDQLRLLVHLSLTRNAIAHSSEHASEQFRKKVLSSISLLPRERRPASFLRTQGAPPATRFEIWLSELASIAQELV